MSADNGIYILKTKLPNRRRRSKYAKFEYRVAHISAVENIFDESSSHVYINMHFSKKPPVLSYTVANIIAKNLHKKLLNNGTPVEYGIQKIEYYKNQFFDELVSSQAREEFYYNSNVYRNRVYL